MPASKFSSALAIMASVVPEGPSVESYDEARAERIAEARVQQEEEEEMRRRRRKSPHKSQGSRTLCEMQCVLATGRVIATLAL